MVTGIYGILNTKNGKWYIGQSVNIERRWYQHLRTLKGYGAHNVAMSFDARKYGINAFEFTVLKLCDASQLDYYEVEYIKKYESASKGYNVLGPLTDNKIKRKKGWMWDGSDNELAY